MAGSHLLHINLQKKPLVTPHKKRLDISNMVVYEREGYMMPDCASVQHKHIIIHSPDNKNQMLLVYKVYSSQRLSTSVP